MVIDGSANEYGATVFPESRPPRDIGGDEHARIPWWTRVAVAAAHTRSDLPLVLLDVVLIAATYAAVLLLRFEGAVPTRYWQGFVSFVPAAVIVHVVTNTAFGLYRQMWRHASIREARKVLLAGLVACFFLALAFLPGDRDVPSSVVILGAGGATGLVGVLRFQARLFAFHRAARGGASGPRVLVVGAGESGATIVRDMLRHPHDFTPVAVLDDDPRTRGRQLSGVRVVGNLDDLPAVVARFSIDQVLLAIPSADAELVRRLANATDALGLSLKVLPSVTEIVGGKVSMRDVRDLSITDLLGRQQVVTDPEGVRATLTGRRVLVTGAGGSIGSEIARQVAACDPARLILLDHDETHLHDAAATVEGNCEQVLADIRDAAHIRRIFELHRPQVVFHAAAHKHVPLLERHPSEAVATNVRGTANVIAAANAVAVQRLVFISTDKAVEPASIMGASKRLGEQILLADAPASARYCAVRFGNVLGSRGSVIPTFMRQIAHGGPVTVTHQEMTRFFMSIPEAVQLVLQASAFSVGGEVFMLDMGQPVRIIDLAERMIRLSGRRVGTDIAIEVVGIRPGEKLAEDLRAPDETPVPTPHPSIVALYPERLPESLLRAELADLEQAAAGHDDETAAHVLLRLARWQPQMAARA